MEILEKQITSGEEIKKLKDEAESGGCYLYAGIAGSDRYGYKENGHYKLTKESDILHTDGKLYASTSHFMALNATKTDETVAVNIEPKQDEQVVQASEKEPSAEEKLKLQIKELEDEEVELLLKIKELENDKNLLAVDLENSKILEEISKKQSDNLTRELEYCNLANEISSLVGYSSVLKFIKEKNIGIIKNETEIKSEEEV